MAENQSLSKYIPLKVALASCVCSLVAIGAFSTMTMSGSLLSPWVAAVIVSVIFGIITGFYAESIVEKFNARRQAEWIRSRFNEAPRKAPDV